jgi:hypothetical protein
MAGRHAAVAQHHPWHLHQRTLSRRGFLGVVAGSSAVVAFGQLGGRAAAAAPSPVLYFSSTELDALPRSGQGWDYVRKVGSTDYGAIDLSDMGSFKPSQLMGAAILYKLGEGGLGRTKIVSRLEEALGTEDATSSPKDFYRNISAFLQTAALVDHDLTSWARAILSRHYGTSSHPKWDQIQKCARVAGHNFGGYARVSLAAIGAYLRDASLVAEAAEYTAQWTGHKPAQFNPTSGFKQSLAVRAYAGGQGTINPITSDWRNGVNVEDGGRGLDSSGQPSGDGITYQEGCLEAQLSTALILYHNGYPDAFTWGDAALLRNAQSVNMNWAGAAGNRQHIPHLLNTIYRPARQLPTRAESKPGHSLGFGQWLASGAFLDGAGLA